MSINVTVSGNPISIKRGKMVTSDSYEAKKEFDKRRLMRLEQVRQQSKDIAEDIRNKVRKEKKKQMRQIEEEGKQKLKNWQNRKLLELQTQYEEALQELGAGHKQAVNLEEDDEILTEQKEQRDKITMHRGQIAATKLQIEKNRENLKKAIPVQQKKIVRDIENTRASLVANMKKNKTGVSECSDKKKKKPIADINITIPSSDSEDSKSEEVIMEGNLEQDKLSNVNEEEEPSSSYDGTESSDNPRQPVDHQTNITGPGVESKLSRSPSPKPRRQSTTTGVSSLTKEIHDRRKVIEGFRKQSSNISPPLDTRISDRIKRRELMASQPDYCDTVAKTNPVPFIESNTHIRDAVDARNFTNKKSCVCGHECPRLCGNQVQDHVRHSGSQMQFKQSDFMSKEDKLSQNSQQIAAENMRSREDRVSYKSQESNTENLNPKQGRVSESQELRTQYDIPEKPPIRLKDKKISTRATGLAKDTNIEQSKQDAVSHKSQGLGTNNYDIPEKPPIKLKDKRLGPSKDTLETYDSHKVNFYDHSNRFSQDKEMPSNVHVERITADSLEVIPNVGSELEWQQKMRQRDREAQIRGQRALEKERIQKDYEEMLKKLPLLQKKERICEIANDKQEYHMSEERLKERDRKRQNELDNAYKRLFPNLKPAVVTLPSKKPEKELGQQQFTEEPIHSLNVGTWDVDLEEPKMFTAEEVQEIVKAFTEQKPKDRRSKLKQLLKSLKLQKEQLIREIKSLPANDSINELISDLNSFSENDKRKDGKSDRKRRREEREKESSAESTTETSSSSASAKHENGRQSSDKDKRHYHSNIKTPSPRKKAKTKSRRKVLVLQNTSTQTTPKAKVNTDDDKSPPKTAQRSEQDKPKTQESLMDKNGPICPKLHTPCDCNKENESTDELCQIVIKINETEEPQVVVKSKEKNVNIPESIVKENSPKHTKTELKSIGVGTDQHVSEKIVDSRVSSDTVERKVYAKIKKVSAKRDKIEKDKVSQKRDKIPDLHVTESKAKSWREQLSKNSMSTASTSYFSPPDFQQTGESFVHSSIKQSLYNLHKKPQQSNISVSPSQISLDQQSVDPKLLAYVHKLLSMSRGSIENLTVSTSSVQTPSQSVIEMESNNPMSMMHNIIKYLNLKDIGQELSYSPDYSPIHYNTTASSEMSQPQSTQEKVMDLGTDQFSKSGKTDQSSRVTTDKEASSGSAKSKDSVLAQYADITDCCSKRIAQLAAMIEQIRKEKIEMIQNPPNSEGIDKAGTMDKDYSTAYLELPSNDSSSKYSSINSLDDEELQRRLLDIDFSLAEKLRKFTSTKQDKATADDAVECEKTGSSKNITDEENNTNAEILSRLKRLTGQEEQPPQTKSSIQAKPSKEVSFVPFLSDIPKLPKLEAQPEQPQNGSNSLHKRPPPSKGLSVAKKYNGNISLVPHELSTIVEADSQLSTKIGSANNSRTSQDISPRKDFQLIIQPEEDKSIEEDTSTSKYSSESNRSSPSHLTKVAVTSKSKCPDTCTNICSKMVVDDRIVEKSKSGSTSPRKNTSSEGGNSSLLIASSASKKSVQLSSSSSDDMDTIEAMLKSIGMEWAIPTLHKTKEALALSSSTSSLELSSKKQTASTNTSGSEVNLRQFLKKQIKISSSTLKSDASPASFSADLSELSSIQANISNADKSNQRTSTPIISSKSTERSGKRVVFSADSDISSVRCDSQRPSDKSTKDSYHSLSEYSESKSDI